MKNLLLQIETIGDRRYETQEKIEYATNYEGPMLILQGTLDPQTPKSFGLLFLPFFYQNFFIIFWFAANEWENAFVGMADKYIFWFKNTIHGTIFNSLLESEPMSQKTCGALVMADFVRKIGSANKNVKADPYKPSGEAIRCWTMDEYFDSDLFDFEDFIYDSDQEDQFKKLPQTIQDMNDAWLLDVDLWVLFLFFLDI